MDANYYIEITGCNLVELVKKAYELSEPRGLGFLHAQPGGLSDEDAQQLVNEKRPHTPVSLDYVKGRCVKFSVYREGDKLFTNKRWYDHSEQDLRELLAHVGIDMPADTATSV